MRGVGEGEICRGASNSVLELPVLSRSMLESDVSRKLLEFLESCPAELIDTDSACLNSEALFRLEFLDRDLLYGLPTSNCRFSSVSKYSGGR